MIEFVSLIVRTPCMLSATPEFAELREVPEVPEVAEVFEVPEAPVAACGDFLGASGARFITHTPITRKASTNRSAPRM
ncbi:MAG TPA: hypothetical protein VN900_00295 [Stellaceae bacterium]|nr:hypothetical protein [Stellaceae bacterium]